MQTKDHRHLACCLINAVDDESLLLHKRAFLLGCVEPDYNLLTYVRGFAHHKIFYGHNAENAQAHILKCLDKLQYGVLHSAFNYFTLGTLLHYTADAFTFPHNAAFPGNLLDHAAYEDRLHPVFIQKLSCQTNGMMPERPSSIGEFFEKAHRGYCAAPHTMGTDCDYIIRVCRIIFETLLGRSRMAKGTILLPLT